MNVPSFRFVWLAVLAIVAPAPAVAAGQALPVVPVASARIENAAEAIADDAADYASRHGVAVDEAERRLRAEQETVPVTDRIAATYADRLAGIAVEHDPAFRIVVLLTGDAPVPDQAVEAGGMTVPIVFRTGARATRTEIDTAITRYQATIRAALAHPPGLGVDPHTGELVVVAAGADVDLYGADALKAEVEQLTGVPARIRAIDRPTLDLAVEGGARVVGVNPEDGLRYACTTGFVVTDGTRDGIVTAAHCPDALSFIDSDRHEVPLAFVGQWGWGYQDVQVNAAPDRLVPLFFANTAKTAAREVSGQRARAGLRAGDTVCHRGERTGYSCAEVELVDFAPAGDLCGGACLPTWTTVKGPGCKGGDSGAPVFLGTTALGLVKGGSYRGDGSCAFYFFMSTDYLPQGWSLVTAPPATSAPLGDQPGPVGTEVIGERPDARGIVGAQGGEPVQR